MKIRLILLMIISAQVVANASTLPEIRSLYRKAAGQEKSCRILTELQIPDKGENISELIGYKAAATMVMAKYVLNPISKINYFRKGKNMLEKAVRNDTKNVELRFLRFTIQTNAPSFLGYNNSIKTDQQFLTVSLPYINDLALKNMITRYLSDLKA
ncbi:hypothetical protein GZH53_07985 [Flavihumibacter sp. R14]|nr:hypothetical protein [Flavihumibacter soli]